jgi:hypothetical protein
MATLKGSGALILRRGRLTAEQTEAGGKPPASAAPLGAGGSVSLGNALGYPSTDFTLNVSDPTASDLHPFRELSFGFETRGVREAVRD